MYGRIVAEESNKPLLTGQEIIINHLDETKSTNASSTEHEVSSNDEILFTRLFERNAARYPNQRAMIYLNEILNYQQVNEKANQLARYLLTRVDLKKTGDAPRIALFLHPGIDAIISFLAIMKAGLIYVPLRTHDPFKRIQKCLKQCDASLIITSQLPERMKEIDRLLEEEPEKINQILYISSVETKDHLAEFNKHNLTDTEIRINPEELAYIIYTSGSTGIPKGVPIKHKGLNYCMRGIDNCLNVNSNDVVAQFASLGFDASIQEILTAFGKGAALYIVANTDRKHLSALGKLYEENSVSIATFVPSTLKRLVPDRFTKLRAIITTGEKINTSLIQRWNTDGRKIINGYGPTEATICTSLSIYDPNHSINIGKKAIPGLEMFIFDHEQLNEVSNQKKNDLTLSEVKQEGELCIAGIGLARGYWIPEDKEECHIMQTLTATKFITIKHPYNNEDILIYRTGDKVKRNAENNIECISRYDYQIKIHGQQISPEEVQSALAEAISELISQNFTSDRILIRGIEAISPNSVEESTINLVAYIAVESQSSIPSYFYMRKKLLDYLDPIMIPSRWVITGKNEFPLKNIHSEKGKIDLETLDKCTPSFIRFSSKIPLNEIEEQIEKIWEKELIIKSLDKSFEYNRYDNFFLLGGTSLQASYIVQNINFNLLQNYSHISNQELYENPTISNLAKIIYKKRIPATDNHSTCEKLSLEEKAINDNNTNGPIFFIHSLLGDPIQDYKDFVTNYCSKWKRPIYAIGAAGLINEIYNDDNLCHLASNYIELIKEKQKHPPFLLVGWSAGGIIAYEIQRQLKEKGEESYVIAIDSASPTELQRISDHEFSKNYFLPLLDKLKISNIINPNNQFCLSKEEAIHSLQEYAEKISNPNKSKQYQVICSLMRAILKYQPTLHQADMSLIIAEFTQNDWRNWRWKHERLGWPEHIKFNVLLRAGDDHESLILPKRNKLDSLKWTSQTIQTIFDDYLFKRYRRYYKINDSIDIDWKRQMKISDLYINLAIVDKNESGKEKNSIGPIVSSHSRLYINREAIYNIRQVLKPEDLFEKHSKKILITGQAGIGKTTMCKNLVFTWYQGNCPWSKHFDWVVWVPLKQIKQEMDDSILDDKESCLKILIKASIAKKIPTLDSDYFIEYIYQHPERVLFLLDSYDEANQAVKEMIKNHIITNPDINVIITSRPYAVDTEIAKLEHFEMVGFLSEDIPRFVKKFFDASFSKTSDQDQAELIRYLKENPNVNEIAQIPINLALICSTWKDNKKKYDSGITKTKLYTMIKFNIIRKFLIASKNIDTPSLNNSTDDRLLTINISPNASASAIELRVAIEFLEFLAYKTIQDKHIKGQTAERHFNVFCKERGLDFDASNIVTNCALRIGFLNKPSDEALSIWDNEFYFLHATIQDYFAAAYIARNLSVGEEKFDNNVEKFMNFYKYDPKYILLWAFIAGLLSNEMQKLYQYFKLLESTVHDEFQSGEISLFLYCLEEIELDENDLDEKSLTDQWHNKTAWVNEILCESLTSSTSPSLLIKSLSVCPRFLNKSKTIEKLFTDVINGEGYRAAISKQTLTYLSPLWVDKIIQKIATENDITSLASFLSILSLIDKEKVSALQLEKAHSTLIKVEQSGRTLHNSNIEKEISQIKESLGVEYFSLSRQPPLYSKIRLRMLRDRLHPKMPVIRVEGLPPFPSSILAQCSDIDFISFIQYLTNKFAHSWKTFYDSHKILDSFEYFLYEFSLEKINSLIPFLIRVLSRSSGGVEKDSILKILSNCNLSENHYFDLLEILIKIESSDHRLTLDIYKMLVEHALITEKAAIIFKLLHPDEFYALLTKFSVSQLLNISNPLEDSFKFIWTQVLMKKVADEPVSAVKNNDKLYIYLENEINPYIIEYDDEVKRYTRQIRNEIHLLRSIQLGLTNHCNKMLNTGADPHYACSNGLTPLLSAMLTEGNQTETHNTSHLGSIIKFIHSSISHSTRNEVKSDDFFNSRTLTFYKMNTQAQENKLIEYYNIICKAIHCKDSILTLKQLNEAISMYPNSIPAKLLLATHYNETGSYKEAIRLCDELIEQHPELIGAKSCKSKALANMGQTREAIDLLESCLDSHLLKENLFLELASLNQNDGNYITTIWYCDLVLFISNLDIRAAVIKALAYIQLGDLSKATFFLNYIISRMHEEEKNNKDKHHQNWPLISFIESSILYWKKSYIEAQACLEQALTYHNPDDDYESVIKRHAIAVLAEIEPHNNKIDLFLSDLLSKNKNDVFTLMLEGYVFAKRGITAFQDSFTKALEINPYNAEVYYYYAKSHSVLKNLSLAKDCLLKSMQFNPHYYPSKILLKDFNSLSNDVDFHENKNSIHINTPIINTNNMRP